jgi:hypothetical protein
MELEFEGHGITSFALLEHYFSLNQNLLTIKNVKILVISVYTTGGFVFVLLKATIFQPIN